MAVKKQVRNNKKASELLTLSKLEVMDKKNDQTKEIEVNGYKININKVFRETKVKQLIAELAEVQIRLKNLDIAIEEFDFTGVTLGLMLRIFSDLPIPNALDGLMKYVEMLIDNNFLEEILTHYDSNEVNKITKALNNTVKNANHFFNEKNEA